jgi:hypothetical protein
MNSNGHLGRGRRDVRVSGQGSGRTAATPGRLCESAGKKRDHRETLMGLW